MGVYASVYDIYHGVDSYSSFFFCWPDTTVWYSRTGAISFWSVFGQESSSCWQFLPYCCLGFILFFIYASPFNLFGDCISIMGCCLTWSVLYLVSFLLFPGGTRYIFPRSSKVRGLLFQSRIFASLAVGIRDHSCILNCWFAVYSWGFEGVCLLKECII